MVATVDRGQVVAIVVLGSMRIGLKHMLSVLDAKLREGISKKVKKLSCVNEGISANADKLTFFLVECSSEFVIDYVFSCVSKHVFDALHFLAYP